ncbi:MAG: hypothetical protein RBS77_05055 [Candidatus Moranbacteria bacterium]|jgi:predicted RND superfamily exporter protein|nr:hypothetical protein [Candidatus Moranbacteria bacterium]
MKDKIKNWIILSFVIVIIIGGIFGGRKVKKFNDELAVLKADKARLEQLNKQLETDVKVKQDTIKKQDARIAELMKLFMAKDKEVVKANAELQKALSKLEGITSDSSYVFLQEIAYKFPGELKYLFNQLQLRGIHSDYLVARSSEQTIPLLNAQVKNCEEQFALREAVEAKLKEVIINKDEQLANCELMNSDNAMMIEDLTWQRDAEKRRKGFWRFTASVAGAVAIVLAVFGL